MICYIFIYSFITIIYINMSQQKRAIIVDENDEVIWYKPRKEIKTEDIYRVSALLIKNTKWQYLLAQRGYNKKNNPWVWSFSVAWTIEEWENYDENIVHEIEEEIWIKWLKFEKLKKIRKYGKHNFFVQFFIAILDKEIREFTPEENQVEQVRRFTKEEILVWEFEWNPISNGLIDNIEIF